MNRNIEQIFVDLDGTLVRTDLFLESLVQLIGRNPFNIFRIVLWILKGRSFTKERVAHCVNLDVEHLPYQTQLVDYLREQKAQGKRIVLATASHRLYAEQVATHLGIFDDIIATQAENNLKGRSKLAAILEATGDAEFAYAGDSAADRPIWEAAAANILVNAPTKDVKTAEAAKKAELVIRSRPPVWRAFVKEMRPHQYAKNALVFVPLFTSHGYQESSALLATLIAFVCFCLCASGVYFLNDLLDLPSDRMHARKRNRPLASGDLSASLGVAGALVLPAIAFAAALMFLPLLFVGVLALYFLTTNAYSFALKRISTVDVMTLAILYTFRVVAGAAATGIALSSWLMAFSVFVFVSLAYLKRYIEVAALPEHATTAHGRGYSAADSETLFALGVANITASVLILTLYINSPEIVRLYQSPDVLWLLCLLMLYWGNRIWIGARRGKVPDDPVIFALKDNVSRMVSLAFIVVVLAAKYIDVPRELSLFKM